MRKIKEEMNCSEHILRTDKNGFSKIQLNNRLECHRSTGRHKTSWKDELS
jgi:hypothetical protein